MEEVTCLNVKVKQEKLSPPREVKSCTDNIISNLFELDKNDSEEKKNVEPAKSSNEILAELFKVFNAAPPESLLNDEFYVQLKQKKRKTKNKKHKKRLKRSRSCSSNDSDTFDKMARKHKKKRKKSKKSKNSHSNDETKGAQSLENLHYIKNEKADLSDFVISEEEDLEVLSKNPAVKSLHTTLVRKESCSNTSKSTKIVIKNLANSAVFKEVKKVEHRWENKKSCDSASKHKGDCSEISLSDEETYLQEKQERYRSFYEARNKGRSKSRRPRYDSSKDRSRRRNCARRGSSRQRSRSRSRSTELSIDKKRLLEIARKNVISMFNNGSLPGTKSMSQEIKDKVLLKMRYGGKTVEDLTEFCKKLSKGESVNDFSSLSSNDDSDHDKSGNQKAFHHPFVLKDRAPIVMNIKNATPIAPKTAQQTKAILMQYPVSSGQHHRLNENEWIPVFSKHVDGSTSTGLTSAPVKSQSPKNVFQKPLPNEKQLPAFVSTPSMSNNVPTLNDITSTQNSQPSSTEIPKSEIQSCSTPSTSASCDSVFPQMHSNIDVSSIITKRLNAMRKLQENPTDPEALKMMYNSQKDMSAWATSKFTPGQFLGTTGANILSAKELTAGHQAWAKRDQLTSTTPVSGGMGMHLLQKMGWRPGEGLGKEKNGSLQPLLLEVKLDKRGLIAHQEDSDTINVASMPLLKGGIRRRRQHVPSIAQTQQHIESKHPVSLLGELSAKRKWGAPLYEIVDENGPAHNRNFIFKVTVNGVMYQPAVPSNTKKEAKALAAKYCLQQLGVLST